MTYQLTDSKVCARVRVFLEKEFNFKPGDEVMSDDDMINETRKHGEMVESTVDTILV